jgi:hypothetical protein
MWHPFGQILETLPHTFSEQLLHQWPLSLNTHQNVSLFDSYKVCSLRSEPRDHESIQYKLWHWYSMSHCNMETFHALMTESVSRSISTRLHGATTQMTKPSSLPALSRKATVQHAKLLNYRSSPTREDNRVQWNFPSSRSKFIFPSTSWNTFNSLSDRSSARRYNTGYKLIQMSKIIYICELAKARIEINITHVMCVFIVNAYINS